MKTLLAFCLGIAVGGGVFYGTSHFNNPSNQPYADEQGRSITSLSSSDVEQLRAGKGWGLAKPAEFNGYPGPAHVIEFADKLDLSADQRSAIDASFATMQKRAKSYGLKLIDAERALDTVFVDKSVTPQILEEALARVEDARAKLREVHLVAHLEVTPLLDDKQKTKYAELRGYGSGHSGHKGH